MFKKILISLFLSILVTLSLNTAKVSAVIAGDANSDNKVDGLDYVVWVNHYNQTISGQSNGNFNADAKVDGLDYVIWLNNYGTTATPGPSQQPTITPSPSPAPQGTTYWVSPSGNDSNAGTQSAPFKTVQKAANSANAGTTVMLMPGTYNEVVSLPRGGSATNPITFQSTKRWQAIITSSSSIMFRGGNGSVNYITLRGIAFKNGGFSAYFGAVLPQKGWQIEDCLADSNGDGIDVRGDDQNVDNVTIIRTVFQNNKGNSIWGAGNGSGGGSYNMQNLTLRDDVFRRNNKNGGNPGYDYGAFKILTSDNTIVDYVTSYDNTGSGAWLDWVNSHYKITNSTFFGNHGLNADWEAPGIWSEVNSDGQINNNLTFSNTGSGVGLLESTGITVSNNILMGNTSSGIEIRSITGRAYQTGHETITNNKFSQNNVAITGSNGSNSPSGLGISVNNNIHESSTTNWFSWNGSNCSNASTCSSKFGFESSGTTGTVSLPPGFKTYSVHTTTSTANQLPTTNESINFESAVGSQGAGASVSVPIYRRGPFSGTGPWNVEIFDLNMRRITLTISSASQKSDIENNISIWAKLDPTYKTITLSDLSNEYNWKATY